MTASNFIRTLLAVSAAAAALVAGFNTLVDPYLLFDRPRQPGFNALKPAVLTREPMMKTYQVARVAPRTVIVGSSRTDIGMDSANDDWPTGLRPVYNLSLAGAGLDTNLRHLRGLLAAGGAGSGPKTLVIGLDFESFLYPPASAAVRPAGHAADKPDPADTYAALAHWRQGTPTWPVLRDMAAGTLTLDALQDSVLTVAGNLTKTASDLQASGRMSEAQLAQWTRADGAGALFHQKLRIVGTYHSGKKQVLSDTPGGPMRGLSDLDALFALARQHQLAVLLAVQPAHASHLDLLDALGYWPDYERWKQALTQQAAAARSAGIDITLWDFGGYDAFALEPIPADGDRAHTMTWFWDPLHYRTALGAAMIATMTGGANHFPANSRLTPGTVTARLSDVRRDRDAYRRANPALQAVAMKLACTAAACNVTN